MIRLKDLLKEIDIANQLKSYDLAIQGQYPLTPEIGKILNKERKTTVFHLTSPDRIQLLKSIENTNKSISAFSEIDGDSDIMSDLTGIRTDGGLLFYVEGMLVLQSVNDLSSAVDETGIRWVDVETTLGDPDYPTDFVNNWDDYIKSNIGNLNKSSKQDYVEGYKKLANKFTELHSEDIIENFYGYVEGYDWNEVIVNNIKLIDCLYDISKVTPDIAQQLQSLVVNEPVGVNLESEEGIATLKNFISSRGGNIR